MNLKMTNFEITIPGDTNKLERQIKTLKKRVKKMKQEAERLKAEIESSKESEEISNDIVEVMKMNKDYIQQALLINQQALDHSQREYQNRLLS